jgi:hypothetical protein
MLGHDVVVFEAREKSGGLNEYGIAKYKLPGDFAQKEVEFLLSIGGIEIQPWPRAGRNLQLPTCMRATTRCSSGSAWRQPRAGPDRRRRAGPDGGGRLHRHAAPGQDLSALPVPRRAIVIGAGNTAIDMAVQLKRLGSRGSHAGLPPRLRGHERDRPRDRHRQGPFRAHAHLGRAARSAARRCRPRARHALRRDPLQDGRLVAPAGSSRSPPTPCSRPSARAWDWPRWSTRWRARSSARRQDPRRRLLPHRAAGRVRRRRLRRAGPGPDGAGGPARQAGRASRSINDIQSKAEAAWPT